MALSILLLSSAHLSYIQNNLGSWTELLRILESHFNLTSLQCLIPEYNLRMKDNVVYIPLLTEYFPGLSHPLSIISLTITWAYRIHINSPQICDCPSLSFPSAPSTLFPYDLLHETLIPTSPFSRVLIFFLSKSLKKPLLPSFPSLSPLHTHLLMLIGFL